MAGKVGPDSYIGSLLTPDFLNWAQDRIQADFTIDLFEMVENVERLARAENTKVQNLQDEVEALKIARDIARSEHEVALEEAINERDDATTLVRHTEEDFAEERASWKRTNKGNQEMITTLRDLLQGAETQRDHFKAKAIGLTHELNAVKAELYDRANS
jgi:membrane-bound lytic murein transglycosylase